MVDLLYTLKGVNGIKNHFSFTYTFTIQIEELFI